MPLTGLLEFLILIVVVGALFYLLFWAVGKLPAPMNPPAQIIVVVIFVIVVIYLLIQVLGGAGLGFAHPLVR